MAYAPSPLHRTRAIANGHSARALTGDYVHTGELNANGAATLETAGALTNRSTLLAGRSLTVSTAPVRCLPAARST
jgi:filamentous hemagglutinin